MRQGGSIKPTYPRLGRNQFITARASRCHRGAGPSRADAAARSLMSEPDYRFGGLSQG